MTRRLNLLNLCSRLTRYAEGLALQERLSEQVKSGVQPDTLVLVQHSPVYTIGKRGTQQDFKRPLEELSKAGVDIFEAPRGGEVTYHGPGQLVAYPILSLRPAGLGARAYVEGIEDTLISMLGTFGISAQGRIKGATGVWVGPRKIAAIGVRISHGISTHGLALNVTTDLSAFDAIIPCGIPDKGVTSIQQELLHQAGAGAAAPGQSGAGAEPAGGIGSGVENERTGQDPAQALGNLGAQAATSSAGHGIAGPLPGIGAGGGSIAAAAGALERAGVGRGLKVPSVEEAAERLVAAFCTQFKYGQVVHVPVGPPE